MMTDGEMAAERDTPDPENPGGQLVSADMETLTREMVTILCAFGRYSIEQIAQVTGRAAADVSALRNSPEVESAILTLKSLLPRPGDVHELLMSDAERNVMWMRELREGRVDGVTLGTDGKTLMVRANMAKALLERQAPKKVEVGPQTLRTIDITPTQRERMKSLLFTPAPKALPPSPAGMTDAEMEASDDAEPES